MLKRINCHCVVFNMDSECFFYFLGTSTKKQLDKTVCCTVLFNMNIVSCIVGIQKTKQQKSNNLQLYTGMCIFMFCTYFSELISYSICFSLCSIQPFVSHREMHKDSFLKPCLFYAMFVLGGSLLRMRLQKFKSYLLCWLQLICYKSVA